MNIMTQLNMPEKIYQARDRIGPCVRLTPMEYSSHFSQVCGAKIHLKLEQLQHSGSFKVRGAFNKTLLTMAEGNKLPLLTASSGNHGLAIAFVAQALGLDAEVVVPNLVSPFKLDLLKATGIKLTIGGETGMDALAFAREASSNGQYQYIPAYNDPDVIAGQGTLGLEIMTQDPEIDIIVAAVGGGGLICGLAAGAKLVRPDLKVIGACAENASSFFTTMQNKVYTPGIERSTLSDGTASALEPDSLTIPMALALVDDFVIVAETEIKRLIIEIAVHDRWLVEGAAALAVAAALDVAKSHPDKKIAVVLCGRTVDPRQIFC